MMELKKVEPLSKDSILWKVRNLKIMLKNEEERPEATRYGAHLSHHGGNCKDVNLDTEALKCLIRHYKRRAKEAV